MITLFIIRLLQSDNWLLKIILEPLRAGRRIVSFLLVPVLQEILRGNFTHAWAFFKHRSVFIAIQGSLKDFYLRWILFNEPIATELQLQVKRIRAFPHRPRISILTVASHPCSRMLRATIDSVRSQNYSEWEYWVVCIGPVDEAIESLLRACADEEPRLRFTTLGEEMGFTQAVHEGVNLASSEWISFLGQGDQLAPFALYEVAKTINEQPDADMLYSDEDKIDLAGTVRVSPSFKPKFNLDYLRSTNYMAHFLVVRRSLLNSVAALVEADDGALRYDLVLKLSEKAKKILHIPKILYHQTESEGLAANQTASQSAAAERVLAAHLQRSGESARVLAGKYPYQVHYEIAGSPKVSMLIPTRDNCTVLKRLLDSILEKTSYPHYELILIENGSREAETHAYYRSIENDPRIKIVEWNQPFNYSEINNFGVRFATGGVVLLLNNDLEVINGDWLERMLEHAQRADIGAVGAKLLYPDNTVQHGGVIVGLYKAAGHSHKFYPHDAPGHQNRLLSVQNYSAVTAACLMVRRAVYEEVGGLDPVFQLEFGDVDFCLRILQKGYRNLWTPYARLYHHESLTRGGYDTREKWKLNRQEVRLLRTRWKDFLEQGDPSYNPNLTKIREDFWVDHPVVRKKKGVQP